MTNKPPSLNRHPFTWFLYAFLAFCVYFGISNSLDPARDARIKATILPMGTAHLYEMRAEALNTGDWAEVHNLNAQIQHRLRYPDPISAGYTR